MISNPSELFIKAQQLHLKHQLDEAISLYKQVLDINPLHQDSLHFLGLIYAQQGSMDLAISYLNQANDIQAEPQLLNNLANAYKKLNRIDKAITCYLKSIELKPDYAQAHNNLATIYALQNNYNKALHHYIKATHLAPDFCAAHFNLGLLLLKNKELEAAKTQFMNVLTLNPDSIEALFYLGVLHLDAGSLEDAESAFIQVLEAQGEHTQALVNLGVIALKKEQNQIAVDYFSKALALDNEEMDARNNLAATFMHHDRFENALMHYDVLLKKEPNNIEYLYNSGVAQMALGHLNEATLFFDQVIRLNPNHGPSLNNLAAVYLKLDMRETSRDYLERALKVDVNDSISRHMLNAIAGITQAQSTPDYAQNLFNNYALYYDQHMQGPLQYSIPSHIGRLLHQLPLKVIDKALDLGCGTGLTGISLRDFSKHLTGVDIAEKMLIHAKEKGIYDKLVQDELINFLQEDKNRYDLIVAADVIPYFGDLKELIQLVSNHLTKEGYFIFTTEINENNPWFLESSARFSHQPQYVNALAADNTLTLVKQEKIPARMQNQALLEVQLYVFQSQSSLDAAIA